MIVISADVASAVWAIASAIAILALGVASLWGGRARPRGAAGFGMFCLAWGLNIALGNAGRLVHSASAHETMTLLYVASAFPVAYFLVEFAAAQVPTSHRTLWNAARTLFATVALSSALVLVFRPTLLLAGVGETAGKAYAIWGPLHLPLVIVPLFTAFALALWALHVAMQTSPTPRTKARAATLLVGLGIYVAFAAANNLAFFSMVRFPIPYRATHIGIYVALTAIVTYIAYQAARNLRSARTPGESRTARGLLLALIIPLVWGAVEGNITAVYAPRFETVGLWRLVGVAVIAYGLARWRLFDLPQRAARTAASAAGVSGAVAGGAATYGLGTIATASPLLPAAAAILVVGTLAIPGIRFARRLLDAVTRASPEENAEDAIYGQRVDAYRAALEASLARNSTEEDSEFLDALRERFGISEAEDRLLRYYARSAVIVPREGDASATYERLRLLGEGGAGRTWMARDRVRDTLVVLKEPLERWHDEAALRDAVLREARLAARIRHPNVVTIVELVEHRGVPIIVMEYVDGGSLALHLRQRGVLPWRDAAKLVIGVLRGIEAAHASGVLHRDIKPSNVLLMGDGTPKVADFGIALPIGGTKTLMAGTSTGFSGTLSYTAPEVRDGSPGDRRSDVYGCAALLHECLYGSPPGPRAPVLAENPVPPPLQDLLARSLATDPARRPATARAFADELEARLGA